MSVTRGLGSNNTQPASRGDLELLNRAVRDKSLVLLDGFHSVKHAVRFGADLLLVFTTDPDRLADLARALAPDVLEELGSRSRLVHKRDVESLTMNRSHWTGVWGVARRPVSDTEGIGGWPDADPIVLLEHPQNLGNIGACVRVAAAAGSAGVVILGDADPWEPAAVRGAAGLQFAVPVLQAQSLPDLRRELIAIDPDGDDLERGAVPPGAVLMFGTEREGLSKDLLARAGKRLRIPMRPGVSSLNLAVAVGIVLYVWKLGKAPS